MQKSIHIFLIILLFSFGTNSSTHAATLSPELLDVLNTTRPDQDIDVIIILTDQVDTKSFAETKSPVLKSESLLRTSIITTLKTKADEKKFIRKNYPLKKEKA